MPNPLSVSSKIGFVLPMLVGCWTVTSLFSSHAHRLEWNQLPASLAIGAVVGLLMWIVFYLIPLTRSVSAVVASVVTLAIMLWMSFPYPIIPAMIVVSTIIVIYDISTKQKKTIASFMFMIIVLSIFASFGQAVYTKATREPSDYNPKTRVILERTPDIYFIVPDRFTSPTGLVQSGYDPSEFTKELSRKEFYVPPDSLSRDAVRPDAYSFATTTTRTLRFMASTLNLGIDIALDIPYNSASSLVRNHLVGNILKNNGYTYHHIGDWWQETLSNPAADYNYIFRGYSAIDYLSQNELATAVVDRSWLREANVGSLLPIELLISMNHNRNKYQLDTFKTIAGNGEHPKFVFLHVLLPHPPYTWSKEGGVQKANLSVMESYLEQVQFTEGYLLELINSIQDTDSIIIIQSDEGIAFTLPSDNNLLSNDQWNGVLSAWYIPGVEDEQLRDIPITGILGFVIDHLEEGQ